MPLNDKQQRFIAEYLVDLNATQAAIRAGYSKNTAGQQGFDLLKHPEIAPAIEAAKADRAERTRVDADWLLRRLVEEAAADIADLYDENGNILPISQWPKVWRTGLISGVETVRETVGKDEEAVSSSTVHKVKLSDRLRRLELIGKHIGVQAFRDQVAYSGIVTVKSAPTDEDL